MVMVAVIDVVQRRDLPEYLAFTFDLEEIGFRMAVIRVRLFIENAADIAAKRGNPELTVSVKVERKFYK